MPVVNDDDVLVRVKAASVNPLDYHFMRGTPYLVRPQAGLLRPKASGLGADMAGYVAAVGKNVTKFAPGEEVFGGLGGLGTLAEYISIRQDAVLLPKPALHSSKRRRCPWPHSPPCRLFATRGAFGPGTRF